MAKYDPEKHHRRSIRLKEYDYSQAGAYFITVCTHNKECLFGEIANGEMQLNDAGRIVQNVWSSLPKRYSGIESDAFIVMPNHVHCIVLNTDCRGESCIRPSLINAKEEGEYKIRPYGTAPDSVGRVIQAFKSITTHEYTIGVKQSGWTPFQGRLWQRNYYEHIIRNEDELLNIQEYIFDNPRKWGEDENNPVNFRDKNTKEGRIQDSPLQIK